MINTGGYESLVQISLETIRRIVEANLICSNSLDLPCTYSSSFNFCNQIINTQATIADSSIGCILPDGRKMNINLQEGPINGIGKIIIDIPLNIYILLSEENEINYEGKVEIKIPLFVDDNQVVASYELIREEDVICGPSPDINAFIYLMDSCILSKSSLHGGQIPASQFIGPISNNAYVNIQWIREEKPPHIMSIDTSARTMLIQFPTILDFDFSASDTGCPNHIIVETEVNINIPYEFIDDSLCLLLKDMYVVDYSIEPDSFENYSDALRCLGYSDVGEEEQKIMLAGLFVILADILPENVCESFPDVGASLAESILFSLKERDPIVFYKFEDPTRYNVIEGKVLSQGISIGFNGTEYPPNNIGNYLSNYGDFTLQISKDIILPKLNEAAEEERKRFNKSDDRFAGGNELILESLKVELGDNRFRVDGEAKVIIDCWPDSHFDFTADVDVVGITSNGQVLLSVSDPNLDYDVSWVDVLLSVITVGIYAVIQACIVSGIKSAIGSSDFLSGVGDTISGENLNLDLEDGFNTEIKHVFQRIEVSPNGIGFWGALFVISPCGQPLGERALWIDAVRKDLEDDIIAIRVREKGWKLRMYDAIDLIEKELIKFGNAYVVTRKDGKKYLRNYPNNRISDNLDELPWFTW